jgi:hypothetical protein
MWGFHHSFAVWEAWGSQPGIIPASNGHGWLKTRVCGVSMLEVVCLFSSLCGCMDRKKVVCCVWQAAIECFVFNTQVDCVEC